MRLVPPGAPLCKLIIVSYSIVLILHIEREGTIFDINMLVTRGFLQFEFPGSLELQDIYL